MKGEAQGRSGASRAGRGGGGRRDGGIQTLDASRGGGGIHRHKSGPPLLDCVVGRRSSGEVAPFGLPASCRRNDAGLLRWSSEEARKRTRGPDDFGRRRSGRTRTRWASKRRTGRAEPMTALVRPDPSPWSAAKPHERACGPPRGEPLRSLRDLRPLESRTGKGIDSFVRPDRKSVV